MTNRYWIRRKGRRARAKVTTWTIDRKLTGLASYKTLYEGPDVLKMEEVLLSWLSRHADEMDELRIYRTVSQGQRDSWSAS